MIWVVFSPTVAKRRLASEVVPLGTTSRHAGMSLTTVNGIAGVAGTCVATFVAGWEAVAAPMGGAARGVLLATVRLCLPRVY